MRIAYEGRVFDCAEGETVLAALARGGVTVPSSCRVGLCQSCLMRAVEGTPPKAARKGLKETWVAQGYFLACSCVPEGDLAVALPDAAATSVRARVVEKSFLSESVVRLRLAPEAAFEYRAGQYVSLARDDGLTRPYSLASVPESDALLEVHVRRAPGGRMSGWIFDGLAEGDALSVRGPAGSCFYVPGREDQPMLLIGTGTGLAPLYGIARDA
ncbi:MAG: 2Fe-2S iron-sulfur cluster binding domain-containing protein, partial [Candidatus Methylomirabilis sp.]|nr:2Fe-2S iron-sulfur cluster binding domain-containing protein [Deltaproteobacteria bacterium]